MAKRSPQSRASHKRAQRKKVSKAKAKHRRVNPTTLPKPIRAARQPTTPFTEYHPSSDFGGYAIPEPEPIPESALAELHGMSVDDKRAAFAEWASNHSHKYSSSYYPEMSDKQVSDAYQVFVFNKQVGYGTTINVGREIWDYIQEYDMDEDLDESDRENY